MRALLDAARTMIAAVGRVLQGPGDASADALNGLAYAAADLESTIANAPQSIRRRLPDLRPGKTLHFVIYSTQGNGEGRAVEVDGYATTGEYEDGRLGEVFVRVGKSGAESAIFDQWAIAFSVALQCDADFEGLCRKFAGSCFEPSGPTNVEGVPRCTSVLDLVCRWLLRLYGPEVKR